MIHELPDARILSTAEQELCTGDSILLNSTVADSGYTYLWTPQSYFGAYATTGPDVWAVVTRTGYVRFEMGSPWGCKASDSLLITTKPCCEVYFPNAFTPNGDGRNDVFRVVTQGHHHISNFRVMNRWGQTIFETADEKRGWDGTFGGADQPMGTYYYYIKYECEVGKYLEQKGEVILLR
jgi:gliding motility-associated-like protein